MTKYQSHSVHCSGLVNATANPTDKQSTYEANSLREKGSRAPVPNRVGVAVLRQKSAHILSCHVELYLASMAPVPNLSRSPDQLVDDGEPDALISVCSTSSIS
jgi:hypothetical protein